MNPVVPLVVGSTVAVIAFALLMARWLRHVQPTQTRPVEQPDSTVDGDR